MEKHSIRAIVEGLNGELWIGTPDGLYKLVLNVEGKAEIKGNYEVAVETPPGMSVLCMLLRTGNFISVIRRDYRGFLRKIRTRYNISIPPVTECAVILSLA